MEGFNLKSAKTEPDMSQPGDNGKFAGFSNLSSSPVQLVVQGAEDATRSAEGSMDLPCPYAGNLYSPLDRALLGAARHLVCVSTQVAGPGRHVTRLLTLALQRRLLSMARDYTACLKHVMDLVLLLCEHSARPIRGVAELGKLCARLWGQIQTTLSFHRKVQADPWLLLLSPILRPATRHMPRVLAQWCVQAALLTDLCIQSVLCTLAQEPDWDMGQLVPSLALYNQAVSEIKSWTNTWRRPRTYPPARVMEVLAEERGLSLARSFCRSLRAQGLQQVLGMDGSGQRVLGMDGSGQRVLGMDGSGQQVLGMDGLGQRGLGMDGWGQQGLGMDGSDQQRLGMNGSVQWQHGGFLQQSVEDLVGLLQEERRNVYGLLQALACSGHCRWRENQEDQKDLSEATMFAFYSTHVWASFCSHIYQAFYGGSRRSEDLRAVSSSGQIATLQLIDALSDTLASAQVPDLCHSESRHLIARLVCTRVFITWDQFLCEALGSSVTDKCIAVTPVVTQSVSDVSSRTARILRSLCRQLSMTLCRRDMAGVDGEDGFLCRCAASLQLCDLWLRSRAQLYTSTRALCPLVLITHADLPVLSEEAVTLCSHFHQTPDKDHFTGYRLCLQIQALRSSMEVLLVSLPHSLGHTCDRLAQNIFQQNMPPSRYWRRPFSSDPDVVPSDYALCATRVVLAPVMEGIKLMALDQQVSALSVTLSRLMEAWMGHVLREKICFSLQGALQLRCDFESVRSVLQSPSSGLSPEVIEAGLSLAVFQQSENAVACLLQQPSRKAYMSPRGCPIFWCCPPLCTASVQSVSDSLQSLDSLERRAWTSHRSANLPQHSHDSYLPHSQRQWLSLRVHKQWGAQHMSWEGAESSDS